MTKRPSYPFTTELVVCAGDNNREYHVTHSTYTCNSTIAMMLARRAAREQGLRVCSVIGVRAGEK